MTRLLRPLAAGFLLAVAVQAAPKNLRANAKPAKATNTRASKVQVIQLAHRPASASILRGIRKHILPRPSAMQGNLTDKGLASAVLAQFTPELPAYFARLDFEGQAIDVLVDTGSSNLLIPAATQCDSCDQSIVTQRLNLTTAGASLVACEAKACQGTCTPDLLSAAKLPDLFCGPHGGVCTRADKFSDALEINAARAPQPAVDHVCLFYDRYGDGSYAAGFLASSNVELAGTKVETAYGAITGASNGFYEAPQGGGIMGMSFGGTGMECNAFSCFPSLFDSMVAAHADVDDVFAICGGSEASPVLLVGGGDSRLYRGAITYVPLAEPYTFYSVDVSDVKIIGAGKDDVSLSKGRAMPPVIIDSGTSGVIVPSFVYSAFKDHLQMHHCDVPYVCDDAPAPVTIFDDVCVPDPDGHLQKLPPVDIKISDRFSLRLTPQQYMQHVTDTDGSEYYCLMMAGGLPTTSADDEMFLIGEALLNRYYIEFDRQKLRLGLAEAVADCSSALR